MKYWIFRFALSILMFFNELVYYCINTYKGSTTVAIFYIVKLFLSYGFLIEFTVIFKQKNVLVIMMYCVQYFLCEIRLIQLDLVKCLFLHI